MPLVWCQLYLVVVIVSSLVGLIVLKPGAVVDVVWVINTSRLQSLSSGGQVHTPFTGKCLPSSTVPAARF